MLRSILFLVIVIILWTCGQGYEKNPALKKAALIHEEAVKIEQELRPQIEDLIQLKNGLQIQGRTLTESELDFISAIESIQQSHDYWEENHVEVPGFEHHDDGHHDHDHDHGAKLDVSPEDMLTIQQEFRDSILSIKNRIERAVTLSQKMMATPTLEE